ncbi:hypothetical protein ACFE04_021153 [Oxalis oulophora]
MVRPITTERHRSHSTKFSQRKDITLLTAVVWCLCSEELLYVTAIDDKNGEEEMKKEEVELDGEEDDKAKRRCSNIRLKGHLSLIKEKGPAYYILKEDKSPCIFGSIEKQRWSYACAKQLIERLVYGKLLYEVVRSAAIDEVLEEGVGDQKYKVPTLLVMNKKDFIKPGEIMQKLQWYEKFTQVDEVIPVSAKYGHGVEDIKDWIISKLPLGPAYYSKVDESDAFDHLIINGFMPLYLTWNLHGEVASSTSSSRTEVHLDGNNNSMDEGDIGGDMTGMLKDANVKMSVKVNSKKRKREITHRLDKCLLEQAHRYVLFNTEELNEDRKAHYDMVKRRLKGTRLGRKPNEVQKLHCREFPSWFRNKPSSPDQNQAPNPITILISSNNQILTILIRVKPSSSESNHHHHPHRSQTKSHHHPYQSQTILTILIGVKPSSPSSSESNQIPSPSLPF